MIDVSLGLAHEAEVILRKCGATRDGFWKQIVENLDVAQKVVDLVQIKSTSFEIVVDYRRSFNDMFKTACSLCLEHDLSITEENFPIKGRGRYQLPLTLINFGRKVKFVDEVIAEMSRRDLRAAKIEELFAFLERYENSRYRDFGLIIALGSIGLTDSAVPYLSRRTCFGTKLITKPFHPDIHFAAVPK